MNRRDSLDRKVFLIPQIRHYLVVYGLVFDRIYVNTQVGWQITFYSYMRYKYLTIAVGSTRVLNELRSVSTAMRSVFPETSRIRSVKI